MYAHVDGHADGHAGVDPAAGVTVADAFKEAENGGGLDSRDAWVFDLNVNQHAGLEVKGLPLIVLIVEKGSKCENGIQQQRRVILGLTGAASLVEMHVAQKD